MEKKTIHCPRCHGILEVTNPKAEPVLLITCPNPACGAKMRLSFDTGETVLAQTKESENLIGRIIYKGIDYQLIEGTNIVGRQPRNSASKANVQLPSDDETMSRLHVQIQVTRLKSGRIKAVISDIRDAEKMQRVPTLVDDVPLHPEDAIVLAAGDIITIGKTRVKYMV